MKLLHTETNWKQIQYTFVVGDTIWEVHCTVFLQQNVRCNGGNYAYPISHDPPEATIEGWSAEGYREQKPLGKSATNEDGEEVFIFDPPDEATERILQVMLERKVAEQDWD